MPAELARDSRAGSSRAVIIQSNYLPWRGYFDLLAQADRLVFLDTVQSTKNDWRNRNRIKTAQGAAWITVPIRHSNNLRIRDVEVADQGWARKHQRTIAQAYARAPFAEPWLPRLAELFEAAAELQTLSAINRLFLAAFMDALSITPEIIDVEDLLSLAEHDAAEPTDRLVEMCRRMGCDRYLSGPAARDYLDPEPFERAGIAVEWFDYDGFAPYPQLHGPFEPALSIVDLLLMTGPDARRFALR